MGLCETLTGITPLLAVLRCPNETLPHPPLCRHPDSYLDMTNHGLQRIQKDFLKNSSYICINLSGNNITEVETGAFGSMKNLQYLNLSGNKLSPEFLTTYGHPNVKVLVLDEAFAKPDLPDGIPYSPTIYLEFPKLNRLFLRRNNFDGIIVPSWQISFPSIKWLSLDGNRISSTSFLAEMPKELTHLSLSYNNLSHFEAGSTENLTVLHLNHNRFSNLCVNASCESVIDLNGTKNLEKLLLSSNNLSTFSKSVVGSLERLRYLDLSNNSLSKNDHQAFLKLGSLFSLDLSRNGLTSVPDLCGLKELKYLNLSHNALAGQINRGTFYNLSNLDHIDLEHNGIPVEPPTVFIDIIKSLGKAPRT